MAVVFSSWRIDLPRNVTLLSNKELNAVRARIEAVFLYLHAVRDPVAQRDVCSVPFFRASSTGRSITSIGRRFFRLLIEKMPAIRCAPLVCRVFCANGAISRGGPSCVHDCVRVSRKDAYYFDFDWADGSIGRAAIDPGQRKFTPAIYSNGGPTSKRPVALRAR